MFRNFDLKVKITFKKLREKNQWGSPTDLVSVIVQESPQAALVALHHQKQAHVPSVAGRVESEIVEKKSQLKDGKRWKLNLRMKDLF